MATKHIADPVHGAIDLTAIEVEIVDTPTFQRLRRIRQLGMANQVYPGADHSRFAHSLGVFSIMSRVAARLNARHPRLLTKPDVTKLRIAALLHDIGHYPYSHLMERINLPAQGVDPIQAEIRGPGVAATPPAEMPPQRYPSHTELGGYILLNRQDVRSVLEKHGQNAEEIAKMLAGDHHKDIFNQLMTSTLDVDRMDYMLRDSHYSGTPFGKIDLEYIIRNLEIDDQHRICISRKAVQSIEHFIFSRWYNYGSIVYQRTVMGLEQLVRSLLTRMAEIGTLPSSKEAIFLIARDRTKFLTFDDHFIDKQIHRLVDDTGDNSQEHRMAMAVLNRVKPRRVYEAFANVTGPQGYGCEVFDKQIASKIGDWANAHGIPEEYWLMADSSTRTLEELQPLGEIGEEESIEQNGHTIRRQKREKLVRVKRQTGSSSIPVLDLKTSLLNQLSTAKFRVVRLYVLFPEEIESVMNASQGSKSRTDFKEQAKRIADEIGKELKTSQGT